MNTSQDSTPNKEPSAAQKLVGDFAPKLAELTDEVLFGDVWARLELAPRDRDQEPAMPSHRRTVASGGLGLAAAWLDLIARATRPVTPTKEATGA